MPDPAEQLQQIYVAGFELKVFDRFPKCVGVVRKIASRSRAGRWLQMLGTRLADGEAIGILVESGGRHVFRLSRR